MAALRGRKQPTRETTSGCVKTCILKSYPILARLRAGLVGSSRTTRTLCSPKTRSALRSLLLQPVFVVQPTKYRRRFDLVPGG